MYEGDFGFHGVATLSRVDYLTERKIFGHFRVQIYGTLSLMLGRF